MKKIELLAPAGDLKRLKIAVLYGADAVYIGGKQFSLRSRASNFSLDDIAEGVKFAAAHGSNVHVTCNILPHEDDYEGLADYLVQLEAAGVKAIIVASLSIMQLAKQVAPKLEVHVSTQHSSTNAADIAFWKDMGMDRVVMARECSMEDIKASAAKAELAMECFIHGGMCISYSGRCTLSNNMTDRDANRGGCAQSCRWKYHLWDDQHEISPADTLFSMSSKDLCAVDYISDLMEAGVASLKIEGRMKSSYYLACVVRCYRQLIDEIATNGKIKPERMAYYYNELAKAENRRCAIGFYAGLPKYNEHLWGVNGAGVTQEFIAYVLDYDEKSKMAKLQVRNNFSDGIKCEYFAPHSDNVSFVMPLMYDEEGNRVETARNPMDILIIKTAIKMEKHGMIRKVMSERTEIF